MSNNILLFTYAHCIVSYCPSRILVIGFALFISACPVCYIPVKQAIASMPSSPSKSPILRSLTYVHDENLINSDRLGGSDFGGYPSLEERNAAFDIKETMTVHCGLVLFCYLYLIFYQSGD
ncbi:hypothetical protein V8G54_027464 [Vigna mungo]|uniref:TOD1/MUCI70 glycosyltransferase-like domain-containing protein n=1 Tax=Vigna mungo TaxID=3915 RepID=A0AAQ3N0T8_VIGMU